MASFMPLKGTKNGFTFEFVDKNASGTKYILTAPDGSSTLVNCFSDNEIRTLTEYPDMVWEKYVAHYPIGTPVQLA